ncbi:(2Fe-2S) ferredoxin domain-containing protein [Kamptonema cortianum]|uniref:(2Fe-2S) ferredoxin domain-containing protein n=1 Tax=Geitlerinema calcuttense NRMC-F 0142 TaxID=2922238 RepID=A0ABT7M076_9CYAN|nr:(2Fe-2S) ferredoxin domain-containing protein [Geitlerinema calcuttense]MDK3155688.1 (2Fe-2S) ferredoxin domain-containing protein [Kamptonema cortianum]MDL5057666.1 (2Fe-2S) ferredoxin domain-containing protein [Geitlerinema calcuttense NRMC-F 0142]
MDRKSSELAENQTEEPERQVLVCQHRTCQKNGSQAVLNAFQAAVSDRVEVVECGCQGQCSLSPTVRVLPDEIWYCRVQPSDIPEIVEQHLQQDRPVERLLHPRIHPRISFFEP